MVSDPLGPLRKLVQSGTRTSGRLLALVAAGSMVCAVSFLLLSEGRSDTDRAKERPSLLELLDDVGRTTEGASETLPKESPPEAPRALAWTSPLARQCSGIDQAIQKRLKTKKARLASLRQSIAIDKSNYGKRYRRDPWKRPLDPSPRVVILHETVFSMNSAINTFQTHHPRDEDQVSYHTLIGLNGQIVDLVSPIDRAFGAGYSAFLGEWAATNPKFKGSVNNFALHLSLETPEDGQNDGSKHSGYTAAQYDALALVLDEWIHNYGFSPAAITTHEHVDLGGERSDPRSFNWSELQKRLAALGLLCSS